MRAIEFRSCLAAKLQRFVELRRVEGSDYQAQARLLLYFDRFLAQRPAAEPRLTRESTEAYQPGLFTRSIVTFRVPVRIGRK